MSCPSCGADNPEGAKFCNECGVSLLRVCSACGTTNAPGAKFCSECGGTLPLAAAPAPPSPPAVPAAERRLVTVLFADLVGFTTLSEARDAEEMRDLLSRYFEHVATLIEPLRRNGREVHRRRGHGRLGHPTATEDDAERAVRAALDLVARSVPEVDADAPGPGRRPDRRGGGHARRRGRAWSPATSSTRPRGSSRPPSPGRCSSARRPAARPRRRSPTRTPAPTSSRARRSRVALFAALRVVSGVRGTLRSAGLEAPFVGRERELRLVKELFHGAADDRDAPTWSRSPASPASASRGWPGSSTSTSTGIADDRLLAPRPVPGLRRGRRVLGAGRDGAHALPDRRGRRPASARGEAARRRSRSTSSTRRSGVRRAAPRPSARPRGARDRRPAGPVRGLASLLRAPGRRPTRRCWSSRTCSGPTPACSTSSSTCSSGRATTRSSSSRSPGPSWPTSRPSWGAGQRNFTSLYLEPLSPAGDERAARRARPRAARAIYARRSWRAPRACRCTRSRPSACCSTAGCSCRKGPSTGPTGEIETLEVPETLHALIAARLDGARADERRLLQDGAVLGKTFTARALEALSGLPPTELEPLLAVPRSQGGPRRPGRPALPRARPVRVPAGPRPTRRLRDAVEARAQDAPPGGGRAPPRGVR